MLLALMMVAGCTTKQPPKPVLQNRSLPRGKPGCGIVVALTGITQPHLVRLSVDENGLVALPELGMVHVAGKTPRMAAQDIRELYIAKGVYANVTVQVAFLDEHHVPSAGAPEAGGVIPQTTLHLAAVRAMQIANKEAQRKYKVAPFKAEHGVARLRQDRWHWHGVMALGKYEFVADISFNRDGTDPAASVQAFAREKVRRGER
ncbi:MAG: polysaccharide biosynthesis/export family protein [Kiritimatiellae bacterium]|nr:polysaccharide biosynthesis/export family protein [Kiritimatiellia bacterium]